MTVPTHIPDFKNLLDVLARRPTARPVLFEFILNTGHIERLSGGGVIERYPEDGAANLRVTIKASCAAGYDFAVVQPWMIKAMSFPAKAREQAESAGMAHGGVIVDRDTFEAYAWPNPQETDWDVLRRIMPDLPDGMKLIVSSPGGILENLMSLIGFEELCLMLVDDPGLLHEITAAIGSRLIAFYEGALQYGCVGAVMVNDDWGFKTQPFFAPAQMREFIAPWHKRMVELIHNSGRPAILHSCGNLKLLWDDIIDDLKFDGKHSNEDAILPVEESYETYGSRIAILGGIDVDFLCRSTPDAIYRRCKATIERTQSRGGYALGSGNSIADYIPAENFHAMLRAALE
jgi:uroporphyrinogen decarboxylase